jgi:hypothetical protein
MESMHEENTDQAEAPLSNYLPPGYDLAGAESEPEPAAWTFLTALRVTLGRPPLWLLTAFAPICFAIIIALPWHSWFQGSIGNQYAPGSQLASLDATFRQDHAESLGVLSAQSAVAASAFAFLLMLVGVFAAGGWLQVFLERTEGHSVHRFFYGGSRYFWRFFRLLLLVLLLLGLGDYAIYKEVLGAGMLERIFGVEGGDLTTLDSEAVARRYSWALDATFLLWFGLVLTWADYTRTRLAYLGSRSVLWAGTLTLFTLLTRPITALRPMLGLMVCELVVAVGLGYGVSSINHSFDETSGLGAVAMLFGLSVLAILWRTVVRAARYHSAVQVTREVVEPYGVDDPWSDSVGGPGGPRYKIGDEELDFEVSI